MDEGSVCRITRVVFRSHIGRNRQTLHGSLVTARIQSDCGIDNYGQFFVNATNCT